MVIISLILALTTIINGEDMDMNILNSFLFHPRKPYQEMGEKDMLIEVAKDVQVGIRCHLKSESFPTILFFHGNGEIVIDYDDIAQVLGCSVGRVKSRLHEARLALRTAFHTA